MVVGASWSEMDGEQWDERVRGASVLADSFGGVVTTAADDAEARAWLASVDPKAYVGSRHHTVPRFLLERWADKDGRVQVYRRIESTHGVVNIRDLAIKDFYTVIDTGGEKNSYLESLLGVVEAGTKAVIDDIVNPFTKPRSLSADEIAQICQFASFQSIRTARHRREIELHAEWYAKTMAHGRVPEAELMEYTIVPHQNQTIELALAMTTKLHPFFVCRPLAIVHLDAPLLLMCDEPIVLNAPVGAFHLEDCFLTDHQIEARVRRAQNRGRRAGAKDSPVTERIIHFSSTRPAGHGTADEILMPVSPRTALLWGPLGAGPVSASELPERIEGEEARRFAEMANDAMSAQALDWVIGRVADHSFATRTFPPTGPLMQVCDGTNAASAAINRVPHRFRPHRLTTPHPDAVEP